MGHSSMNGWVGYKISKHCNYWSMNEYFASCDHFFCLKEGCFLNKKHEIETKKNFGVFAREVGNVPNWEHDRKFVEEIVKVKFLHF